MRMTHADDTMTTTGGIDRATPPRAGRSLALRLAYLPGPWLPLAVAPVLLVAPLVDAVIAAEWARLVFLLVIGAAFALVVSLPYGRERRPGVANEAMFAGFLLLVAAYIVTWQADQAFLFPLLAVAASASVRSRWALGMVGAVSISGATAVGFGTGSLGFGLLVGFAAYASGAANVLARVYLSAAVRLERTQEDLALAAVAEERARFSRDLHDLLGHSLSVIAVKSEAARRLVEVDPDAAAGHVSDIESIARDALAEVRSVVSGVRSVSLAEELRNARRALASAGIDLVVGLPDAPLPISVDALLGWVVREATTNVLRHSGARRCRIEIVADDDVARIEVTDDGRGRATGSTPGGGIAGLQDRLARAGGRLQTDADGTRFRLAATVPLDAGARA